MSLPTYPKYKDSGVQWLGKVPEHWEIVALKRIATLRSGETISADDISEAGDYPVYGGNGLRGYTSAYTHEGRFALIGRQGALCGNVNYGAGRFWASEHAVVASPIGRVSTSWLGEMLRAMNLNQYSVSAAQPGLSVELVGRIKSALPPYPEQVAIAAFLDLETSKIDALVAEQQRLIELLKEKRQTVISHAVTKGLNPDVPMKASGVKWLGAVPTHWKVMKVKHLARSIEQGWSPQCEAVPAEETEWGVLKVGCVNGGSFDPHENKLLPPELEPVPALAIRAGDLLVSRANTRELAGSAAVAERDYPRLLLCDKLYRLRFRADQCAAAFVSYYLGCAAVRGRIEIDATGASASMVNIAQSTIFELQVALPPIEEQRDIIEYLDAGAHRSAALANEMKRAVDLLEERRTAVIAAAVTGQIDVRLFGHERTA